MRSQTPNSVPQIIVSESLPDNIPLNQPAPPLTMSPNMDKPLMFSSKEENETEEIEETEEVQQVE